jgi:hypothetical protein
MKSPGTMASILLFDRVLIEIKDQWAYQGEKAASAVEKDITPATVGGSPKSAVRAA